ncbi:hypothetical protein CRG98_015292 [Punica granatum]|uniref:Uncharacterized protein n=1 Tax=Punica granatum TaxID=22663 RepID=A0A2I0K710_PUNGR|nr:hypothetical protein CRG98_015292 [Punica granatum]
MLGGISRCWKRRIARFLVEIMLGRCRMLLVAFRTGVKWPTPPPCWALHSVRGCDLLHESIACPSRRRRSLGFPTAPAHGEKGEWPFMERGDPWNTCINVKGEILWDPPNQ